MTVNETKEFLDRIKAYYPSFIVDEFFVKEWHRQLKDYEAKDINERFNQHLKSEQYGEYIPKINFLTKGLKKIGETGYNKDQIFVRCSSCNSVMSLTNYDKHIPKCKDIEYMVFLTEKYLKKSVNKAALFEMEESLFEDKFKTMLKYAYQNEANEEEKARLKEIYETI